MENSSSKAIVAPAILLRAPALPCRIAGAPGDGTAPGGTGTGSMVAAAIALAAPELGLGRGEAAERARRRYRARMEFRPTPAGLLAGVFVGGLGARTAIATGSIDRAVAHLELRWERLAALGRALLDDPAVRPAVRLRAAPSLLDDGGHASWLAPGAGAECTVARAEVDPLLGAVLAATAAPTPWPSARAALAVDDPEAADDFLLQLVDGGLLVHDLEPPLIGPPPLAWMIDRLARIEPAPACLESLRALREQLSAAREVAAPSLADRIAALSGLGAGLPSRPGRFSARDGRSLGAVLELRPPAPPTLDRQAVERAAQLAPLLFRLLAALAPTWERVGSPGLDRAVRILVEQHEPGGFGLAALESGRHGVALDERAAPIGAELPGLPGSDPGAAGASLPAGLLRLLVDRLVAAGPCPAAFSAAELDAVLPAADLPSSCELILAPAVEPTGALPGEGWLLGLHGPAGSIWGRFAHALGSRLAPAFAALRDAERAAFSDGGNALADLAFAPGAAVADVAVHPPLRAAAVALTGFGDETAGESIPAGALELVLGPALQALPPERAPSALSLRHRDGRRLQLAPLARVRSTTIVDDGAHRLLAGFALQRAFAPWALHLGPLADLARTPRVTVDGFVIAPASFRLPRGLLDDCANGRGPAALWAWREAARAPRHVQIGFEDQLLGLDLDAPEDAAAELARAEYRDSAAPRAWEIWPPIDRLCDRDGRRVEAVVAVLFPEAAESAGRNHPDARPAPARARRSRDRGAGGARSCAEPAPARSWRSLHLYCAEERGDRLLARLHPPLAALGDLATGPRAAVDRWFFLRYVDGSGRHHLRLRLHGTARGLTRAEASLGRVLEAARADGELAAIETAEYRPEVARFGGPGAMAAVERIFQSDSALCAALVALDPELRPPGHELLPRSFDALARGLGFLPAERGAFAAAARRSVEPLLRATPPARRADPLAPFYRAQKSSLVEALRADQGGRDRDAASPLFKAHARRLAELAPALARPLRRAVLPSLLHLAAVRLVGPGAEREAVGYYLWDRVLEAIDARRGR